MFTGFSQQTIQFFLDIRFHNSIQYFQENRERYERDVKAPFWAFVEEMAPILRSIDPLMELRPYRCVARLRRDIRFTRDKSPFRDHLWVSFRHAGEPREGSVNYWYELTPRGMSWGLGTWGENRPMMDTLRRRMAAKPEEVLEIISGCHLEELGLRPEGNAFKRLAIPENIPEVLRPWYPLRDVYVGRNVADVDFAFTPALVDALRRDYEALSPLYRLLRGAYETAEAEEGPKL